MLTECPHCKQSSEKSGSRISVVKSGSFLRRSDNTRQQRFLCRACAKSFSLATTHPCFRQKKRHLNPMIFRHLASGVSQRRLSTLLEINRKTVVRKFIFIGLWADYFLNEHAKLFPLVTEAEFDDLETLEHSKLKPLSVLMMTETKTRRVLGFRVARMPCKGLLARKSLKKYGWRKDERARARQSLFHQVKPLLAPNVILKSDESPHYPKDVEQIFPQAKHQRYKGRRGCVVGQGELKSGGFDPLFTLNHTFAMFRANINRLFRRSWNTTKKPERLALHLAIYCLYHNCFHLKLQPLKNAGAF